MLYGALRKSLWVSCESTLPLRNCPTLFWEMIEKIVVQYYFFIAH